MSSDTLATWLCRQGHRVIQTRSSLWYDAAPSVYQAAPYHWLIEPDDQEIEHIFRRTRAIALRFSTPRAAAAGAISYHMVYTGNIYECAQLPKKTRHAVTQGLEYTTIQRISIHDLANEGWHLRYDTLVRQGREYAETEAWWRNVCLSSVDLTGFEAWGALHKGKLVAALLAFVHDDWCSILYQQSLTEHLKFGINNALTFTFTQEILRRPVVSHVFYGLHSLDAPPSVDEFKLRMGYSAKVVRQRVVFHPLLTPLVNSASHSVLRRISLIFPKQTTLSKATGLLRFHIEGKRPLDEQNWPELLSLANVQ
jgi:hypothetical protein